MKNYKYAKLLSDGKIEYADSILHGKYSVIISPSAKEYKQFGFLPVEDKKPQNTDDLQYVRVGWKEEDEKIISVYKTVQIQRHNVDKHEPNVLQKALRKIAFKMIGTC